ncbi:hypothetical protein ASPCAL04627 [Aspergillus calidoustus]|uniref:Cell wall protein PhiA n=1 Tax=Aspergillus calidoustus TaxID=454130 RepID=A0A0U5FVC2_ASPCI|nr:hypothetical protein ASPCAL04627 [Aspergillus calidoustus]
MKLNFLAAAASIGFTTVAAQPAGTCPPPPTGPDTFGLVAINSGGPAHYAGFNAARRGLFAGYSGQNADCDDGPDSGYATFYLKDGALFLYGPANQQIFVDRSGMGQGIVGYTNDGETGPRNGERTGWAINADNHLQFAGSDFLACPIDNGYRIWAAQGFQTPGGSENCVGVAARVEKISDPNSCTYSSS